MPWYTHLFFIIALVALSLTSQAQPEICEVPVEMTPLCKDACVICDIDGYTGRHASEVRGEAPPDFCTLGVNNALWIAFIAGSERLVVDIRVSNCNFLFIGLEMALYESLDCESFNRVSNCRGGIFPVFNGTSARFTSNEPLTIGQHYYIVMDGSFGSSCNWTLDVVEGSAQAFPLSTTGLLNVPDVACDTSDIALQLLPETGVAFADWVINKDTLPGKRLNETFKPDTSGTYEICVTGFNPCFRGPQVCDTITVFQPMFTIIDTSICVGSCFEIGDSIFCDPGNYTYVTQTTQGCDSAILININVAPTSIISIDTILCEMDCLRIADSLICDPGSYLIRKGTILCDSIFDITLDKQSIQDSILNIQFCSDDSPCLFFFDSLVCGEGTTILNIDRGSACPLRGTVRIQVFDQFKDQRYVESCNGDTVMINNNLYTKDTSITQIFTDLNGCDSIWTTELLFREEFINIVDTLLCTGDTLFFLNNLIASEGIYPQFFTKINGCDSTIILNVELIDCPIYFEVESTSYDGCGEDSKATICFDLATQGRLFNLNAIGDSVPYLPDTLVMDGVACITVPARSETIVFSFSRGIYQENFTVSTPSIEPLDIEILTSDYQGFEISCFGLNDGMISINASGGLGPFRYEIEGQETSSLQDLGAGSYAVKILDARGCADSLVALLREPPNVGVYFTEIGVDCENASRIIQVKSSITDLNIEEIYVEGMLQPDKDSILLDEGSRTIAILDSRGCSWDSIIVVREPELSSTKYPDTIRGLLFDSVSISPSLFDERDNIFWTDASSLSCQRCPEPKLLINNERELTVEITSTDGCVTSETIHIEAMDELAVIQPNIFSPNEDKINDNFLPVVPFGFSLIQLTIFDRWGNIVWQTSANGQSWDGTINGQPAPIGVYIWAMTIVDNKGNVSRLGGNVTLIR